MLPHDYDAWYHTPRGAWIGATEYRLLRRLLAPRAGELLLDAGCGTGYFTQRFARDAGVEVVGLDADPAWAGYAHEHTTHDVTFVAGRMQALPFAAASFDLAMSVTALCFIQEQRQALVELLRVTRRRFVLGLLNRRSLLHREKGADGGSGAYLGAHWHTADEIRALCDGLPVANLHIATAVFLPGGTRWARSLEPVIPTWLPWGGFIAVAGDVTDHRCLT